MVSGPGDRAVFFQKRYDELQKVFSTFNELLTKDNSFGMDFQSVDSKTINSEIFGEQIQVSFTVSFGKEPSYYSFGKLDFFRIYPGKTQDDKEEFWHLFFDDCGNTYDKKGEKAHTYNISKTKGSDYVVALMINTFIDKYLIES